MKTALVLFTALMLLPFGVRAEEAPAAPTDVPRAQHLTPGAAAPFDGMLLNRPAMEMSAQALADSNKATSDALTEVAVGKEELRLWKERNSGGVAVGTVVGIVVVVAVVAAAVGVIAGVVVAVQAQK